MRQSEPVIEDSGAVEDVHHLRLMALLRELVREKGNRGAAAALGIDPRTVASCMRRGRVSWRVREALERGLQSGVGSAAARQRERNDTLEGRLAELEKMLQGGLEEFRSEVVEEVKALLDEQGKAMRRLERRIARVESVKGIEAAPKTDPASAERPAAKPLRRIYRELVTEGAEPDEERVYGEAVAVIVEWRAAKASYRQAVATGSALRKADARIRLLELEIELIEGHELTLPPATHPWNGFDRRDETWLRRQSLGRARSERTRAALLRLLRRAVSLGRWRD